MVAYASLHRNNIGRVTRADKASAHGAHLRMIIGSHSKESAAQSAREPSLVASILQRAAGFALVICLVDALAGCSGAVGPAPTPAPAPGPITITPSTATLFSDLPTTFVLGGGNGVYVIASSDQSVIPFLSIGGHTLTIVPGAVAADTVVTLTVGDTAGDAPASATLTVKPRTVSNVVTIIPSASQSAVCGNSICSGGDAEVRVKLSLGGAPLAGRTVRFDVVSGDVRIITSPPGSAETLATSGTAVTDSTGTASIRIRVLADATSQTALLQVTDLSSGFTQRTSVSIAPSSNAPLNAQPATITFQGVAANTCASGIAADVIVFGGRSPYLISQPGSFTVQPTVVTSNPGRFTVTAIGQCTSGSQIAIVDANGATVAVTAINRLSDVVPPAPTPTPTFAVAPTDVTLNSCTDSANVTLVGGTGNYLATSGSSTIDAVVNGSTGTIRRALGQNPAPATVSVAFSDGQSIRQVTVNVALGARTGC